MLTGSILREVLAGVICTIAGLTLAVATYISLLFVLLVYATYNVIVFVVKHRSEIAGFIRLTVSLSNELLFHGLGLVVAVALGILTYSLLLMVLFVHGMFTTAVQLKRSKRRKRYFRRTLKVISVVTFIIVLKYLVGESETIVRHITNHDIYNMTYGKTPTCSFQELTIFLGYIISGRSISSS